ncbi:HAMP domain-containing sensor histidine kinase [Lachnospiraceae bacterium 48-21]
MEVKGRQKTISSVFFRYACFYTAGVLFWMFLVFVVWYVLDLTGEVLPANHMETRLSESAEEICKAPKVTEDLLPEGCGYGVYQSDGKWLYGTFSEEEIEQAWEHFRKNSIYARKRGYYRFLSRDSGEICIVKYEIATRFRNGFLGKYLPSPEILLILSFLALFLVHTVLTSRHFGRYMKKRLLVLNETTARIRDEDLEFEEEHSEIKEVEDVLTSLNQMKEALKESLYRQWNLEKGREEQIAALAHDIKTPLTVIRGNAELLAEGNLGEEEREYDLDILQSVSMMEEYLAILNGILAEEGQKGTSDVNEAQISCLSLAELFTEQARLLGAARQFGIVFYRKDLYGEVLCNKNQLLRAFQNILSNAMDYSPKDGEIEVLLEMKAEGGKEYFTVTVEDQGTGFSAQDIRHATERFYQGDQSRSSKLHHGIGLHTAKRFVEAQGGELVIGNAGTHGGRVTMLILSLPC